MSDTATIEITELADLDQDIICRATTEWNDGQVTECFMCAKWHVILTCCYKRSTWWCNWHKTEIERMGFCVCSRCNGRITDWIVV